MILFFFLSYKGENQSFGQGPVARQQGKILACQDTCSKTFSLSSVPFHAMWKPRNCIAFGGKKHLQYIYYMKKEQQCGSKVIFSTNPSTSQRTFQLSTLGKYSINEYELGRITKLVLFRQSPMNLHQFCLTRDSKYGLVGTVWNAICRYFGLI